MAQKKPVVGVIGSAHLAEGRFATQRVGERNMRAVANAAGALPLMFAATPEITDETVLHSLVSRNIVREFGRFLPESYGGSIVKTRAQQIKSLVEDSGYTKAEATILVDGGF